MPRNVTFCVYILCTPRFDVQRPRSDPCRIVALCHNWCGRARYFEHQKPQRFTHCNEQGLVLGGTHRRSPWAAMLHLFSKHDPLRPSAKRLPNPHPTTAFLVTWITLVLVFGYAAKLVFTPALRTELFQVSAARLSQHQAPAAADRTAHPQYEPGTSAVLGTGVLVQGVRVPKSGTYRAGIVPDSGVLAHLHEALLLSRFRDTLAIPNATVTNATGSVVDVTHVLRRVGLTNGSCPASLPPSGRCPGPGVGYAPLASYPSVAFTLDVQLPQVKALGCSTRGGQNGGAGAAGCFIDLQVSACGTADGACMEALESDAASVANPRLALSWQMRTPLSGIRVLTMQPSVAVRPGDLSSVAAVGVPRWQLSHSRWDARLCGPALGSPAQCQWEQGMPAGCVPCEGLPTAPAPVLVVGLDDDVTVWMTSPSTSLLHALTLAGAAVLSGIAFSSKLFSVGRAAARKLGNRPGRQTRVVQVLVLCSGVTALGLLAATESVVRIHGTTQGALRTWMQVLAGTGTVLAAGAQLVSTTAWLAPAALRVGFIASVAAAGQIALSQSTVTNSGDLARHSSMVLAHSAAGSAQLLLQGYLEWVKPSGVFWGRHAAAAVRPTRWCCYGGGRHQSNSCFRGSSRVVAAAFLAYMAILICSAYAAHPVGMSTSTTPNFAANVAQVAAFSAAVLVADAVVAALCCCRRAYLVRHARGLQLVLAAAVTLVAFMIAGTSVTALRAKSAVATQYSVFLAAVDIRVAGLVIASTLTLLSVSLDLEHAARFSAVERKQHTHQHWSGVPSGTAAPLLGGNHGPSAPMDAVHPTTNTTDLLPTTPTAFRRYLLGLGPVPGSPELHSTHGAGAVSITHHNRRSSGIGPWRGGQDSESAREATSAPPLPTSPSSHVELACDGRVGSA